MQSSHKTVEDYIASLPSDQQETVSRLRSLILESLPGGYVETMNWGMISYEIPLHIYPDTYNSRPLSYAALARQKNYYSLYLTGLYARPGGEEAFRGAWEKSGKTLDMGKSCIRFKRLEDLNLDLIAEAIASVSPDEYIKSYEQARASR